MKADTQEEIISICKVNEQEKSVKEDLQAKSDIAKIPVSLIDQVEV